MTGRFSIVVVGVLCLALAFVGFLLQQLAQRQPPPQIVLFHGAQDGMIPPDMSRALSAEFPGFVSFHELPEANHDTVVLAAKDQIVALMGKNL